MPYATSAASSSLRTLSFLLALLLLPACGSFKNTKTADGTHGWGRGRARPAASAPEATTQPEARVAERDRARPAERAAEDPSMTAVRVRVYEALAEMTRAEAEGDAEAAEAALDAAMDEMRRLVQSDAGLEAPEMRELYRSVVTAYEQYYGVSDTLMTEYGDIFAFREEAFSTLNALTDPLLEDVMLPELRTPVAGAIALDRNQLVEQSIRFLLREPDRHLYRWMSRSATYFPMIEQILREEGVPEELKYLAMIESALNPRARSRVGASGLWQFMPATGREYGLQVTHWVDERWDPEKSTRAAARYLRNLYKQFGDWHLALAAYNCGPGRVQRARQRFEAGGAKARFWDLYPSLPTETRNYVPMFIAAALVSSNPDAFDLRPVQPGPRYAFDVVEVEGSLDLRTAAELAGTDVDVLRALNPEIRQWTTPPSRTPYRLRVPVGSRSRFTAAFAALPAEAKRGTSEHRVRRGDTLGRIARRYGTTVTALQELNGLGDTTIREGQVLYVPVRYEAYTGAEVASAGTTASEATSPPPVRAAAYTEPEPARAAPSAGRTRVNYRVRRGDNLTGIAARYGVTVDDLKAWNNLADDQIRSGQMLALYPGDAPARAAAPASQATTYTVRRGDNLTEIAARHGVTVADLRAWNDLSGDQIRPGQRLTLHATATGSRPAAATARKGWISYEVRRGDTLAKIARRYDATAADVKKWNALSTDRLQVGQRLAIFVR